MKIGVALAIWLIGWGLIILLHTLMILLYRRQSSQDMWEEEYTFCKSEVIKNGNNLFATGVVYFIFNIICYFWQNDIAHWVIFIVGIAAAIPSIASCFSILAQTVFMKNKYETLNFISCFINTFVPIGMALNILFCYILQQT